LPAAAAFHLASSGVLAFDVFYPRVESLFSGVGEELLGSLVWHIDGDYRLALAVLMFTKKILESIAILAAGIVGILLRGKAG